MRCSEFSWCLGDLVILSYRLSRPLCCSSVGFCENSVTSTSRVPDRSRVLASLPQIQMAMVLYVSNPRPVDNRPVEDGSPRAGRAQGGNRLLKGGLLLASFCIPRGWHKPKRMILELPSQTGGQVSSLPSQHTSELCGRAFDCVAETAN